MANQLLEQIRDELMAIRSREAALEAEIERVRAEHAPEIERRMRRVRELEKELKAVCEAHEAELFADGDSRALRAGTIFKRIKVSLQGLRGVLARLKSLGWTEAIRVSEAVDRKVLESWDNERLRAVGITRKETIDYEYQIKE